MVDYFLHPPLPKSKSSPSTGTELRFASGKQLMDLFRCVRNEMQRRAANHKTRDAFADLIVNEGKDIPEAFWTSNMPTTDDRRIPKALRLDPHLFKPEQRLPYLKELLAQDWSFLWPPTYGAQVYYVYAHVDPKSKHLNLPGPLGGPCKTPFYVGKGTKDRAYNLDRNQGHGIRLRQLLQEGYRPDQIVRILSRNLFETAALELEAKLIYFFGTIYEKDRKGVLLNLDTGTRPAFTMKMQKLSDRKLRVTTAGGAA